MVTSDQIVIDEGRLYAGERDYIDPADWFVDGHPFRDLRRHKKSGSVAGDAAVGEEPGRDPEHRLRAYADSDWRVRSLENKVDRATEILKKSDSLPSDEFDALAKYVFHDFPKLKRAALAEGKFSFGKRTVCRRSDKTVAA
jgi:hypothetical protein